MNRDNATWFDFVMKSVRPWIVPPPRPPFSRKELKLLQFRQNLDQCSADQKLTLMVLLMLHTPSISKESYEVRKAYHSANSSFFLRSWQRNVRNVDVSLYWNQYNDTITELTRLFIQMKSLERGRLMYQLLLISKKAIRRETIIVYNYFFSSSVPPNEGIKIIPRHFQEDEKQRLILELSHAPSLLVQSIFHLHQQLETQIVNYFQQMLSQLTTCIDLELAKLLQEMISHVVQDAIEIGVVGEEVVEDYNSELSSDSDNDLDSTSEFDENPPPRQQTAINAIENPIENYYLPSDSDSDVPPPPPPRQQKQQTAIIEAVTTNYDSDANSDEDVPPPPPRQRAVGSSHQA